MSDPSDVRSEETNPSSLVRDLAMTFFACMAMAVSQIMVTRLLAERLGPEHFGAYSISRRILSFLMDASMAQLGMAVARYVSIASTASERRSLTIAGLVPGVLFAMVVAAGGSIFRNELAVLFFASSRFSSLLMVTLLMFGGAVLYSTLYAYYRGTCRMGRANLWQLLTLAVVPLAVAFGVSGSEPVHHVVGLMAIPYYLAAFPLCGLLLSGKNPGGDMTAMGAHGATILRYAVPRVPSGLAFGVLFGVGPFLAAHLLSLRYAGYLIVGQSVVGLVFLAVDAFSLVILPRAARLHAGSLRATMPDRIQALLVVVLDMGLFATVQCLLWSDWIVAWLLGGGYGEAVSVVRGMIPAMLPGLAYAMLRSVIDAIEVRPVNTRNIVVAALVTAAGSGVVCLTGGGILGLAIAFTAGYTVLGFLTVRYLGKTFSLNISPSLIGTRLLLNGAFGLLVLLVKPWVVSGYPESGALAGALCLEASLLAVYIGVLRRMRAEWTLELEKRFRPASPISTVHAGSTPESVSATHEVDDALSEFYAKMASSSWDSRAYYLHPVGLDRRTRIGECLPIDPGMRLLDLGCGGGELAQQFVGRCEVHGVDIAEGHVIRARARGIQAFGESAVRTHYPDAAFDAVICSEVIEHFGDPRLPLRETWRLLKPRGHAVFTVHLQSRPPVTLKDVPVEDLRTLSFRKIERKYGVKDTHLSFFDERSFLGLVESSGFRVERVVYTSQWRARKGMGAIYRILLAASKLLNMRWLDEGVLLPFIRIAFLRDNGQRHHIVVLAAKPKDSPVPQSL